VLTRHNFRAAQQLTHITCSVSPALLQNDRTVQHYVSK